MAPKVSAKKASKASSTTASKSAAKISAARKTKASNSVTKSAATTTASKAAGKTVAPSTTVRPLSKSTAAKPALSVVKEGQNANPGQELKKRELLDQIVKRTDVKKKFAKPVMEAMMEVLGEALAQERPLNLQPMGKVMPKRTKEAGTNRVITARIRQSKKAGLSAGQAAGAGNSDPVPGAANPPVAKPAE